MKTRLRSMMVQARLEGLLLLSVERKTLLTLRKNRFICTFILSPVMFVIVVLLRAIDGFVRSIDCAAPSMDSLIAHLSIDRAIIDRSRNHLSIAHYCACAIDGWNMLHVLWCETVLQLLRHYLKPVASFTTIASC